MEDCLNKNCAEHRQNLAKEKDIAGLAVIIENRPDDGAHDKVLYLNKRTDLLAGITGHPWWYREREVPAGMKFFLKLTKKQRGR